MLCQYPLPRADPASFDLFARRRKERKTTVAPNELASRRRRPQSFALTNDPVLPYLARHDHRPGRRDGPAHLSAGVLRVSHAPPAEAIDRTSTLRPRRVDSGALQWTFTDRARATGAAPVHRPLDTVRGTEEADAGWLCEAGRPRRRGRTGGRHPADPEGNSSHTRHLGARIRAAGGRSRARVAGRARGDHHW